MFGSIRLCDIFGDRPDPDAFERMLDVQTAMILETIRNSPADELCKLRAGYGHIIKHVTSRPGAMALPQDKIRLFEERCMQCIRAIDKRLDM